MERMYIDNTRANQSAPIPFLSVGEELTRHGIKYRLRAGCREIDGTYNLESAMRMIRDTRAVISFYPTLDKELSSCILDSGLKVVEDKPEYQYLNTSMMPVLSF